MQTGDKLKEFKVRKCGGFVILRRTWINLGGNYVTRPLSIFLYDHHMIIETQIDLT